MAFRKMRDTVEDDQPAETEVEGEIREFVRRDVVTNLGCPPENESEMVASSINSVLQRATATSVQEIDRLITEMQTLRDTLHSEATRVQGEVFQYATLTQAALQSTKIIAESPDAVEKGPRRPMVCSLRGRFATFCRVTGSGPTSNSFNSALEEMRSVPQ